MDSGAAPLFAAAFEGELQLWIGGSESALGRGRTNESARENEYAELSGWAIASVVLSGCKLNGLFDSDEEAEFDAEADCKSMIDPRDSLAFDEESLK